MPESLLRSLQFLVLGVLYLFFLRVLRAVWVATKAEPELTNSPAKHKQAKSDKKGEAIGPSRANPTTVVNLGASGAQVRTFAIGGELTIGRAAGCQIHLGEDSYASSIHARIYVRDNSVIVEDLGSTNGTLLNSKPLLSPTRVRTGDRVKVGSSTLEFR